MKRRAYFWQTNLGHELSSWVRYILEFLADTQTLEGRVQTFDPGPWFVKNMAPVLPLDIEGHCILDGLYLCDKRPIDVAEVSNFHRRLWTEERLQDSCQCGCCALPGLGQLNLLIPWILQTYQNKQESLGVAPLIRVQSVNYHSQVR